jgi:hypothetical protein
LTNEKEVRESRWTHREQGVVVAALLLPLPRMQIKLLAPIAALRESTYVWERILSAETPAEMLTE